MGHKEEERPEEERLAGHTALHPLPGELRRALKQAKSVVGPPQVCSEWLGRGARLVIYVLEHAVLSLSAGTSTVLEPRPAAAVRSRVFPPPQHHPQS